MQITIDIPESVAAKAAQQGMSPETYAERAVVEWTPPVETVTKQPRMSLDEFFRVMATNSRELPVLPPSVLTRESMYDDND